MVLDQLKSGLCVMGVADAMATYPEVMEAFFVAGKQAPGNQTNYSIASVQLSIPSHYCVICRKNQEPL